MVTRCATMDKPPFACEGETRTIWVCPHVSQPATVTYCYLICSTLLRVHSCCPAQESVTWLPRKQPHQLKSLTATAKASKQASKVTTIKRQHDNQLLKVMQDGLNNKSNNSSSPSVPDITVHCCTHAMYCVQSFQDF